jgi:hypothetical protein
MIKNDQKMIKMIMIMIMIMNILIGYYVTLINERKIKFNLKKINNIIV